MGPANHDTYHAALERAALLATSKRLCKEIDALRGIPIKPGTQALSLREQAIRNDMSPALHRALDQAGVGFLPENVASRLGAHAIDDLHLNAFREIQREHPDAVRAWLAQGIAIANAKIAYPLATKKISAKRRSMVALATAFGADWSIHRPGIAKQYPNSLARYDEVVAWAAAQSMEASTPPAPRAPGFRF